MKDKQLLYRIPRTTTSNTNTKTYNGLGKGLTFYVHFKLDEFTSQEECLIGIQDQFYMGVFLQKPNLIKFSWHDIDGVYNDLGFLIDDIHTEMKLSITVDEEVKFTKNDVLIGRKDTKGIRDYSEKDIVIGAINPHYENWECKFGGELYELSVSTDEEVIARYDFKETSRFKVFDISGNGNHAVLYEDSAYRDYKINEYNDLIKK